MGGLNPWKIPETMRVEGVAHHLDIPLNHIHRAMNDAVGPNHLCILTLGSEACNDII